jgi:MoaA/NifB/PqqE/SkfB family radical SAM enzyme
MHVTLDWRRYGEYTSLPCSTLNSIKLKFFRRFSLGSYPHIVNFAITWKCNSRCKMCNIWRERSFKEISPELVAKIFSDKLLRKTRLVKVTGGEPTLHSRLPDVIKVISDSCDAKIAINTNGFPFERIKKVTERCLDIRDDLIFSIGLDGIGDTHNYIRGRDCYSEVMKSIDYFDELRDSKNVLYRFSFTITPWNYRDLPKVVELARRRKTYIGFRVIHLDKLYRNEDLNLSEGFIEEVKPIIEEVGDNYFKRKIGETNKAVRCFAFINSVFIDPDGNFHPCLYRGSEGSGSLSEIWNNKRGRIIRKTIKKCKNCWSDCQSIPNIIAEFGKLV